ncbi:phospholipase-like, Aminotransferase-like mobile domain protein [Artemisia annua]|uniref:Phospholipase-like, Aminotransferase-like mobile domain protein n=1 Tax=Artemisia annua TaxID=35608 RepID=A0A2U1PEB3_ARTAN|nr:phospholipase-like, Aminotransferase-like mobile domain protein [Artemisia annua]
MVTFLSKFPKRSCATTQLRNPSNIATRVFFLGPTSTSKYTQPAGYSTRRLLNPCAERFLFSDWCLLCFFPIGAFVKISFFLNGSTCFGPWLDLTYVDNEEDLIHYMLQKQVFSLNEHYDLPLIYDVNEHLLHFGRREFCLITGFKFGIVSFRKFREGDISFRDRVFPEKIGRYVKTIDLLSVIEDQERFTKLLDEDSVRVCLLLSLEVIFMGRELGSIVDDVLLRMVDDLEAWNEFPWGEHIWRVLYAAIKNVNSKHNIEHHKSMDKDPNFVPSYSLSGFLLCFKEYHARVHVRSKLSYFPLIKDRLGLDRCVLFRSTCFGPWLDLTYVDNEEDLIHYILQKQVLSLNEHYDLPLIYDVNEHLLHFGRREFCLITGFKFGIVSFRKFREGDISFRDRVFPEKIGRYVKTIDLLSVIEYQERFTKLSDEDSGRVCLLLSLEVATVLECI